MKKHFARAVLVALWYALFYAFVSKDPPPDWLWSAESFLAAGFLSGVVAACIALLVWLIGQAIGPP